MKNSWIIELETGVWLTKGDGDPSRTLEESSATVFTSLKSAQRALKNARKFRPFKFAKIL